MYSEKRKVSSRYTRIGMALFFLTPFAQQPDYCFYSRLLMNSHKAYLRLLTDFYSISISISLSK